MDTDLFRRKKIRLSPEAYRQPGMVCSVTICAANRARTFDDPHLTDGCVEMLKWRAEATGVAVHAYCFMPDHLHLLMSPSLSISVLDFVRDFKSRSTRLAWRHGFKGGIWQERFFDHFLRKDEDIQTVVNYIVSNPVRAGMVSEWSSYAYSGSLVYDLLA